MDVQKYDIAWCWDGKTKTAELIVNGVSLEGKPVDVENIFHTITDMRSKLVELEVVAQEVVKENDKFQYSLDKLLDRLT